MSNAILAIFPYKTSSTWVFDDPAVELRQEPFVSGMPEMIDLLVTGIPNWYQWEAKGMEGWLCPAMFHYFRETPADLYCKAEALPTRP